MATTAAVLNILVSAQTGKASADLRRLNGQLKATEVQASRSTGMAGKFGKAAKVGVAAGAAAAAYGLYKSVSAGARFEKQIDSLGAVSQATGRQMKRLEKQALALGESTQYTANEVALAQTELAKGGLTLKQIMSGGLRSALSLAAAGELELAEAASTTVNAMKLFGLRGKDAMKVADMLATAANKTTADVGDFALALKQGGSVARLAGMDFNETVTVLEALAEAGIKSSDAGTSLKAFFINIGTPSVKAKNMMEDLGLSIFNAKGQLKELPELAANLRQVFGDVSKEEFLEKAGTIAGSDAIRTLFSLYDAGPKKLRALEQANQRHGTAQDIAAEKTDNLKGDVEELGGAFETKGIKLYQKLAPALRAATQAMTDAVKSIDSRQLGQVSHRIDRVVDSLRTFWKESGVTRSVVIEAFRVIRDVVRDSIESLIMITQGWVQVLRGIVKVISGILTGDLGRVWSGVKDIFAGGVKSTIGVFRGITAPFRRIAATAGGAIKDAFGFAWDKIEDLFEDRINNVIGFINGLIDVINLLPGVPDIGKVGEVGGSDDRGQNRKGSKGLHQQHRFSGGPITRPMAIVGEEAPRHHEWVIATNPAFKKANLQYWAQAGADLGVPGFATGGLLGKAAGAVGDVIGGAAGKGADFFIDKLPKPGLQEPFAALGPYLINQVSEYIRDGFREEKFGTLIGLQGSGRKVMKEISARRGWNFADWWALDAAETSHGKNLVNPTSSARLRGQFLDINYGKYGPGSDPAQNPSMRQQIISMARYIAERYGNPTAAWRFHQANNYYAKGGLIGSKGMFSRIQQLAQGGMIDPSWDPGGETIASSIAQLVGAYAKPYDIDITSGYDPSGHVSPGHLEMGTATDVVPRSGNWGGAFAKGLEVLAKLGFEVGYDGSIPGTESWPNHGRGNHAHIEWVGNGTAADARQRLRDFLNGGGGDSSAHSSKEDLPAVYKGARTDSLKFGAVPKSLHGIEKELHKRRVELKRYRAAAADANKRKKPRIEQAITQNIRELEGRVQELERARALERRELAKRKISNRLSKALGKLTGFESLIEAKERSFSAKDQTAQQIVDLEPLMPEIPEKATNAQRELIEKGHVDNLTRYIQTQEEPAYQALLGSAGEWRNTILAGQQKAAGDWQHGKKLGGLEGHWEDKILSAETEIDRSNEYVKKVSEQVAAWRAKHGKDSFPDWLKAAVQKQHETRARLPILRHQEQELRKVLGEGRERFYPGKARVLRPAPPFAGSGSFEDALENVQGVHWPAMHEQIGSLPADRVAGMFGGVIWDVQTSIAELGMKIRDAAVGGGEGAQEDSGESERLAFVEEQLRQANQRNLVFERHRPIIDAYESKSFAGMFAKGGSIPAGMWGIVGERGPEPVFAGSGPATVLSNRDGREIFGGGSPSVLVQVVEGEPSKTKVFVGDRQVEAVVEKVSRRQGRAARSVGARKAGRLG